MSPREGSPLRWSLSSQGLERLRSLSGLALLTAQDLGSFKSDIGIIREFQPDPYPFGLHPRSRAILQKLAQLVKLVRAQLGPESLSVLTLPNFGKQR